MPDWAKANIERFRALNPGYDVQLHGEEVLLDELKPVYAKLTDLASKSDLLRYSALSTFGGWYFDCDFWPFRPIDDIVHAYGLKASKFFICKQHGNVNPAYIYANSPLACSKDSPVIKAIIKHIKSYDGELGRCTFGPEMMLKIVPENEKDIVLADWPWFFPADTREAVRFYSEIQTGGENIGKCICDETNGQFPFAMHLWAAGRRELKYQPHKSTLVMQQGQGDLVGIIASELMINKPTNPMSAIASGLLNQGYRVEVRDSTAYPVFESLPKYVICWNGLREPLATYVRKARTAGTKVFHVEHGFYDRKVYSQIDHESILHWASWTSKLDQPAPAGAKERFDSVWKAPIIPTRRRKRGYVLVIGQVNYDTQLSKSEFDTSKGFEEFVSQAQGVEMLFRPHPLDQSEKTRRKFIPRSTAPDLKTAVENARFVITINSNSGVECLAWGCPVLCFGPATYAMADVAIQTNKATFKDNLQSMLNGWIPEQDKVDNYLYWLAGRQWSLDEFREGSVLNRIFEEANE